MHADSQAPPHRAALDIAVRLLDDFSGARDATPDPGIPVLACLVAEMCGPRAKASRPVVTPDPAAVAGAGRAVAAWARTIGRGPGSPGLYDGGLAGTLIGLRLGARIHAPLHRVADRLRDHLLDGARARPWRTEDVALPDYDLICGPSGTLLALCVGPPQPKSGQLIPFAAHLAKLCDSGDLRRLRVGQYSGHPYLGWLQGRVNTGMGHGVAGLVAGLTAAVRHVGPEQELLDALRSATRWLVRQSFDDARSVRSWDGAGLDGPPPAGARARQAWCYGAPGVTWALWDASDALGDREAADWAAAAFTILAERYDEDFHLYGDPLTDQLALCHGAAGVLAVADAFHRHARLPAAAVLRDRLAGHLGRRLPTALAPGAPHTSLLNGTAGALGALLTATHDTSRDWLACLGLR
ncbi:lanthionine synthetase LanC family protein [Streptomyces sp. sk2.1]|uniref:lanthionine synthetase LanC family protein n=1 Tax=Streptomyces sp. sk2.1 TaxID=2478959 RepID=UPI0011E67AF6|nr:lanthionine synthetase LanC family protein [Streptomyces sp. sk2.1]TXS78776.1 subtilin biosynthesis protein spaC [Streptomyces sp. sk2.1]